MGFEKFTSQEKPEGPGEVERRKELEGEDPERALVAHITTARTPAELEDAVSGVLELEQSGDIPAEKIAGLKEEVNRRQIQLLGNALFPEPEEEGGAHEFKLPSELENIHWLISLNPAMAEKDREQYVNLWREKLEPQAEALFAERLRGAKLPHQLEELREMINAFPFSDEDRERNLHAALDEKINLLNRKEAA